MQPDIDSYLSPRAEPRAKPDGQMAIFATAPISAGEVVSVWGGDILDREGVAQLPEKYRHYVVQVEEDFFLGGGTDDPTNYFNHSCDPNLGLSGQIVLVAMRDIAPGEELCFDYATSDGSPYDEFDCTCGTSLCRKVVRGDDWKNPELWERYRGYFIPYLQRRIDLLRQKSENDLE